MAKSTPTSFAPCATSHSAASTRERGVVVVVRAAEALGPSRVEQHDVAGTQARSLRRQALGGDRLARLAVEPPDHAGAVQPLERDLVKRGTTGDEVAGRIHVRAVVADHRASSWRSSGRAASRRGARSAPRETSRRGTGRRAACATARATGRRPTGAAGTGQDGQPCQRRSTLMRRRPASRPRSTRASGRSRCDRRRARAPRPPSSRARGTRQRAAPGSRCRAPARARWRGPSP